MSLAVVSPATAQPVAPTCPAVVADQPLSVTTAFSGTVRPRAGDDGRIESTSLLCAYGEGAAPAAEVTVTWDAGPMPCATTEVAVATGLDARAFAALAGSLAATAGTDCPASSEGGWPVGAVAGGLLVGVVLAVVVLRRRRNRRGPAVVDAAAVEPETGPEPPAAPEAPAAPVRVPDAAPVLAGLRGPGGRDFARTGAGQLAVVATAAYLAGDSVSGDLARAASLSGLPVGLRPRAELAALVVARAHHDRTADR